VTHSLLRRHTIDEPTRRRAVAIAAAWRLSASTIRCSPVDWCPAQQPPCIGWSRVLANLIATTDQRSPCSFGLSATSQHYSSLRTNQPPTISQQYFSLRTNQYQPSATCQTNRLGACNLALLTREMFLSFLFPCTCDLLSVYFQLAADTYFNRLFYVVYMGNKMSFPIFIMLAVDGSPGLLVLYTVDY
jgi:hypothetical protein